jgi:hypothetical protein
VSQRDDVAGGLELEFTGKVETFTWAERLEERIATLRVLDKGMTRCRELLSSAEVADAHDEIRQHREELLEFRRKTIAQVRDAKRMVEEAAKALQRQATREHLASHRRAARRPQCSSGRPAARRAARATSRAGPDDDSGPQDDDPSRPWAWQPRPTLYPVGPRCAGCLEYKMWWGGRLVCVNGQCPRWGK